MDLTARARTYAASRLVHLQRGEPLLPHRDLRPHQRAVLKNIPAILRELAAKYRPEGFTDNSWSGLPRASICYARAAGASSRPARLRPARQARLKRPGLSRGSSGYGCRLEIWDSTTPWRDGRSDCLWVGMIGGSLSGARRLRDYREICRAQMTCSTTSGDEATGFQGTDRRALVHGLLGQFAPEHGFYQTTGVSSVWPCGRAGLRLWALEAFAGGISPGGTTSRHHEDRRILDTAGSAGGTQPTRFYPRRPGHGQGWSFATEPGLFGRDDAEPLVDLRSVGSRSSPARASVRAGTPTTWSDAGLRTLVLPTWAA
jgi:hypothetical protein